MPTPISSELKTSTGNITIPANCDFVVALVLGLTNPSINDVAMTQEVAINAGPAARVSISVMASPPTGTIGCTVSQETRFVYLTGGESVRDAGGSSTNTEVTLDSSATDLILGIQSTDLDASLTVDGSAMTYLDNYYRGYLASPDDSVVCDGEGSAIAFISVIGTGGSPQGDGTMMCWIN